MRYTPENITHLEPGDVFVFGSNLAGIHGGGAARAALQWGAQNRIGEGRVGQTYALPTKDHSINTRYLPDIYQSVVYLLQHVEANPNDHFLITKVGCGLAGLTIEQVAPMFRQFLDLPNVSLPVEFFEVLNGI